MPKPSAHKPAVDRPEDIPRFASEAEEDRFWADHELGDEMLDRMAPPGDDLLPPSRPRAKPVSVRFDEDMLGRLKALAARRGTRYQTLLKQFIAERLYEEERHEGPPAGRLHGSSSTRERRSHG